MKKQGIICTLSVVSLSLCALAFKTGDFVKAYAEENETSAVANDFYMESGASVRIDENAGVRFSAHISESKYDEIVNKADGKEVKVVTIVNRADLGVTHGASKAVEYEHVLPEAKDGEYTVTARVVYTELSEENVKLAASVELEAQTYIVVGDWESVYKAEQNDNVRSMRSVAYAALAAKEVTSAEVAKYLGTVSESESAALLNTAATEIDVSALSAEYGNYTAAYIGAKKIGEVKDGKIDLNEAYSGNAAKIVLMDSANNAVSVPLQYAGSLSAAVNSHKYGKTEAFADGTKITLSKDGKATETVVENGIISAELPAGTYTATLNGVDGYLSGTVEIVARETNNSALTLEYDAFAPTSGMADWGSVRDFSKQNDGEITLNNDIQFIYSKDTFKNVAFTLTLQSDWNSAEKSGRQGIAFRFKNDDGYQGIVGVQTEGERILQFDGEGNYANWWKEMQMPAEEFALAEGSGWDSLFLFENRTELKDKLNNGTLEITVARDGASFYVFADGEYVGGKTFADKYADMECELGFYYFNFAGNTNRTWKFGIDENVDSWLEKIPTSSINAEIYLRKANEKAHLADGTEVIFKQGGLIKTLSVESGRVNGELVSGTYSVYTDDSYAATLTVGNDEYTDEITLEYKVFDLLMGYDEAEHDFSHVNDAEPTITIGNNKKTLNVITRDTYDGVAASLWIKDGNSTNSTGTQGIVIKFADDKYMITRCEKMSDGNYKLQWMANQWGMETVKGVDIDFQSPLSDAQKDAFEGEGLQLTLIRSGNVLTIYANGEKIPGASVLLASEYASQKVQVGFFDYDSKANATWKFKIESNISDYDTSIEKLGAAGQAYTQSVNLTGDVWQAVKVKVNPGYTGEVRIGFVSDYGTDGTDGTNCKKSVLYQDKNWIFQETDSWKGGDGLSDELKNALTGTGIYLAYHRNAETGEVKLYAAVSKEELENAIKEDKAVLTCNDYEPYKDNKGNDIVKFSTKSITSVGIYFWGGSYTASATGYGYGDTSADALKNLA